MAFDEPLADRGYRKEAFELRECREGSSVESLDRSVDDTPYGRTVGVHERPCTTRENKRCVSRDRKGRNERAHTDAQR